MLTESSQYQKVTYYMILVYDTLEKAKVLEQRPDQWFSMVLSGGGLIKKGKSKEFGGIFQSFYVLAVILVIRIYACVKICRPVHQTVNFT